MTRGATTVFWTLLSVGLGSATAHAQATRTWVSGVGDDANPCSRTAPCKTFAGAISKTAPSGEINALDPGGFGAVTITKALTIDGGAGQIAGVLVSGTNGINVSAGAGDVVTLRNLDIDGLGSGIDGVRVNSAKAVNIENSKIYGFSNYGINFATSNANAALFVSNSLISDNVQGGVRVAPGAGVFANADLQNIVSTRNAWGVAAVDRANVTVQDSSMINNTYFGFLAYSASVPSVISVKRSIASHNAAYGLVTSGANASITMSQTASFANLTGVAEIGGTIYSFGDNQIFGNQTDGAPNATVAAK